MKKIWKSILCIVMVAGGFAVILTIWDLLTTAPYSSVKDFIWCAVAFFVVRFGWELIELAYWIHKDKK